MDVWYWFPKSYNISKGFDKQAGVEGEVVGKGRSGSHETHNTSYNMTKDSSFGGEYDITKPVTDNAKKWEGWGTQLKPAHEPILLAQKPREDNYCENIDEYNVGGINIDGCRVDVNSEVDDIGKTTNRGKRESETWEEGSGFKNENNDLAGVSSKGRFPANLVLSHHPDCEYKGEKKVKTDCGKQNTDRNANEYWVGKYSNKKHSNRTKADEDGMETVSNRDCHPSCPVRVMNEQNGETVSSGGRSYQNTNDMYSGGWEHKGEGTSKDPGYGDKGGVARYFNQFHFTEYDFFKYESKASKSERTHDGKIENKHPTVKPVELMRWLVRMITPDNGIVLDPFLGSGTTCLAVIEEGFNYIGIEKDESSFEIARMRINDYKEGLSDGE